MRLIHRNWAVIIALVAILVMGVASTVAYGAPTPTCTITVDIPDDLNSLGAKIDYYPWSHYRTDGQNFTANQGSTVTWIFIVNGFGGKQFSFKVPNADTATLTVGSDAYCTMKVINVPSGGKVNVYPWNTYWVDNQTIVVPIGGSCTWKLIVNGFSGDTYTKSFDCTPLDVNNAVKIVKSYCDMVVQMPDDLANAGGKVNVYPWNTYWGNGTKVTVPIGGSCKWKLIVNGFSGQEYTKNFDCTPLVVNDSHYCTMTVKNVPEGMKVCVYPWNTYWTNGQQIIVPISGSCTWKLTGPGAPSTQHVKHFDCTDLDASEGLAE
jgi:hypothetical protein